MTVDPCCTSTGVPDDDRVRPCIHHLFTSPGHNYFGHHEKPPGEHPVEEYERIELVAGRGIRGDRFFDFKDDYKGQVAFIDHAVVQAVREFSGRPELPAAAFRRNVVVSGVELNQWIGKRFRINGLLLEGSEECRPCYWMDRACGREGTEELMKGRGGLRCRILDSGTLQIGPVTWEVEG